MHLSGCQFQNLPTRNGIPLLQNPGMQCGVILMHPSKGILTSGGDKTHSHRTDRRAAYFKSARAGDRHECSSLLPEFKKGKTKLQYLLEALNGVTKDFSDIENESDDCDSDE